VSYGETNRNDVIITVVITLAVVAVILGLGYFLWDTGRANNEKSLQTQLACIEAGGTWVGSSASTCVAPPTKD
jgi:heme/copper-type cytochrome/quinol oxidase subunit 4